MAKAAAKDLESIRARSLAEEMKKPIVGVYRLLAGRHSECDQIFTKGDVFASRYKLERHNQPPHSVKFERLADDTPLTVNPGQYENIHWMDGPKPEPATEPQEQEA